MKRVIIEYSYTMKDGTQGKGKVITTIENEDSEIEAKIEARRDFSEDNGFYKCFDVLDLTVDSVAGYD